MRVVIQRVSKASVTIDNEEVSSIKKGLVILLGIENDDTEEDVVWLCRKIYSLRVFNDNNGVMNLSMGDVDAEAMVVSQFTLHAKTKKGNRPSYIKAAHPDKAIPLYKTFISELQKLSSKPIKTGEFGAMMEINLTNSGPVTIIIDTKNKE